MALRTNDANAWQDIAELQCPEVNGAREQTECAKAYVDGAWEEVWSNATYFVKNGVLMNGASLGTNGVQKSAYVYGTTPSYNTTLEIVKFQFTSDMVGKKLYVRCSSNVIPYGTGAGNYGFLMLMYPKSSFSNVGQWCTSTIDGVLVFDITADHVGVAKQSSMTIDNTEGNAFYHIYDIYVK